MITQNGFLISYLKYGDNDAILHTFTKEKGFQSFYVKGIYSAKNKKKAYLLPLNELHFSVNPRQKGNISAVSKLELIRTFDIFTHVKASSIVFFVADFLNQILKHEENSKLLYSEIELFLSELENKNYQSHFIFLFRILKIQGFSPLLTEENFLNPEDGKFSNHHHHALFNLEISTIWRNLISAENSYQIKINPTLRKDFLDSLLVYYHEHYANFRTPNSLEIVQQIFE